MDNKLILPFARDLKEEAGWIQLDRYLYFAARLHLHIEEQQTGEFAVGDILQTFHTTAFSETDVVQSFEEECTLVDLRETARSAILSDELSQSIAAGVRAAAKSPLYELSSSVETTLQHAVRRSVERSVKTGESVSRRRKRIFTVSQRIRPGTDEPQLAVEGYRRYVRKVFLHYVDYLFVAYEPGRFGWGHYKVNLPRPIGSEHVNRILVDVPLFRLVYWKLEPESSLLYTQSEYARLPKAEHPDRVRFEALDETIHLSLPRRLATPTLYTLANKCFPARWGDRRRRKG